jgi:hypothetical protein
MPTVLSEAAVCRADFIEAFVGGEVEGWASKAIIVLITCPSTAGLDFPSTLRSGHREI